MSHKPVFVSTVEIGSESFRGVEAKTRKQAEMNAAEVAYCALTKGKKMMTQECVKVIFFFGGKEVLFLFATNIIQA